MPEPDLKVGADLIIPWRDELRSEQYYYIQAAFTEDGDLHTFREMYDTLETAKAIAHILVRYGFVKTAIVVHQKGLYMRRKDVV